jgi:hypothetical protein
MMNKYSEFFYRRSTGAAVLITLLAFLSFAVLVLPGQSAKAEAYSGEAGSPDLSLFYSADDLYRMAESYGPEGRADYVRARFTFDLAFPLVYGLFLTACVSWLLNRALAIGSRWRLLNLAPLAGVLFDLLENISASLVISRFPAETPAAAALAPVFTLVKWVFVAGSFVLLFIAAVLAVFQRKPGEL